jgi:hypothetical protein
MVAMSSLAKTVAIVTGASKGIGSGIAEALAGAGARLAVNYSSTGKAPNGWLRPSSTAAVKRWPSGPTCPKPQMFRDYSKKSFLKKRCPELLS